jgi:uncharacterized membrane protein YhaH (DUF805 family)
MKKFFWIKGEKRRLEYFLTTFMAGIAMSLLIVIAAMILPGLVYTVVAYICIGAYTWVVICNIDQRLQDLYKTVWHIVLLCIPFYNIYLALTLLFVAGQSNYVPSNNEA